MPRIKKQDEEPEAAGAIETEETAAEEVEETEEEEAADPAAIGDLVKDLVDRRLAERGAMVAEFDADEEDDPNQVVEVTTHSVRPYAPGTMVSRWGYRFFVGEDGRTLTAEVPLRDAMSGVQAGRWLPKGMSLEAAGLAYWRAQYAETHGTPPPERATLQSIRAAVEAKAAEMQAKAGDSLKATRA